MSTNLQKPKMVQCFDKYKDREYYKITPGFFGEIEILLRTDSVKNYTEVRIQCEDIPERVVVNGQLYKLKKIKN